MLDEESRQKFAEEEWAAKQQDLAEDGGPPVRTRWTPTTPRRVL